MGNADTEADTSMADTSATDAAAAAAAGNDTTGTAVRDATDSGTSSTAAPTTPKPLPANTTGEDKNTSGNNPNPPEQP